MVSPSAMISPVSVLDLIFRAFSAADAVRDWLAKKGSVVADDDDDDDAATAPWSCSTVPSSAALAAASSWDFCFFLESLISCFAFLI